MNDQIIKLGIVDDETLIVSLLSSYFEKLADFQVVLTAESGEQLLSKLDSAAGTPDILLLDINMGGMSGIDALKQLREKHQEIQVIVMSSHYKKNFTGFMLKNGVAAFIPKGISPQSLSDIIRHVKSHDYYFLPEQMDVVRKQISSRSPEPVLETSQSLSEREVDVLRLICEQKTSQEISEFLHVTRSTVEGHKRSIFAKTNTKNIAGLVIYAVQNEIVDINNLNVEF